MIVIVEKVQVKADEVHFLSVSTLHRCSYDSSTISSVDKLETIWRFFFPFFPFFHFSYFTFLFNLFCFLKLMSKSRFIEIPGH